MGQKEEGVSPPKKSVFHFILIKPSHYDDDGYVIQWLRSAVPSNTLAALNGLALDCAGRGVLGEGVDLVVSSYDESNSRIRPDKIAKKIKKSGGMGLVGLVGVQSNQFPRALDLARDFRELGVQVCIGGFHVSGCLSMLPEIPVDLQEAMDLGISLFAGEVEGRLDEVLQDVYRGELKPLYNYLDDLPGLEGAPTPILPSAQIKRTGGAMTSFDAGRGCPFQCSFCTIINVQGRKSRRRSADDVERIVRANIALGIKSFFITDDNFARNLEWEPILDRLIELREEKGLKVKLTIQVDTLCHKIKGFIEKCERAGVKRVFIGLESINPEALAGAKKRQNRIGEYREMLQAWHTTGATTCAGYILGFPTDTPESIVRDIKIIQRELPIDILEFFILTPLPGSEDHQKLYEKGVWMDPDMNKYDSTHVTTAHPLMTPEEWKNIYDLAWGTYYTPEHMEIVLQRARRTGISRRRDALIWFSCSMSVENVHPLDGGYFRLKYRRDRRRQLPVESPFFFYPRRVRDLLWGHARILALAWKLDRACRQIKKGSKSREYTDLSLTPVTENERFELELLTQTPSARAAAGRHAR
ncbi:B12-binding domain-containing radical SAM protein [Nitrospinota bacterium]